MTAVVEVDEQYVQQFQQFIKNMPQSAIKIRWVKNNLKEELEKRIDEIKQVTIKTHPLHALSSLRERYAGC